MTTEPDMSDRTTMVVGASRGLGRGIAQALAEAGMPVIAVARTEAALEQLAGESEAIRFEVADAADPVVAGALLDRHEPRTLVLVAGATPLMRPLAQQTWETFSVNWQTDVRLAFGWLREVLLKPLAPGSRVIVVTSGAAVAGSPLSGGYAGAKATVRFITAYARDEASRSGLGISFTAVLPRLTPATGLGRPAVKAYAARNRMTEDEYVAAAGPPLTPEIAGAAALELAQADTETLAAEYLLSGGGLKALGDP